MVIVDIRPLFGKPDLRINNKLVFVLMPFKRDLTDIYENYVKPKVKERGLECRRADDRKAAIIVMNDIWRSICQARIIIADLTYRNPNVMYELGIAHSLGKDTILIYQRQKRNIKFPFDLANIQRIEYKNTVMGAKTLIDSLSTALNEVLDGESYHLSSDDMLNIELKNYLESEYRRRKKRIEWFSHHCMNILRNFKEQHVELLTQLNHFIEERSETSINRIIALAKVHGEFAADYIIPFIKSELDKVEDYLENPWLVNKFPDELYRIGDAMNRVKNLQINLGTRTEDLHDVIELIEYRINRIDFYIEMVEEEKKALVVSPP